MKTDAELNDPKYIAMLPIVVKISESKLESEKKTLYQEQSLEFWRWLGDSCGVSCDDYKHIQKFAPHDRQPISELVTNMGTQYSVTAEDHVGATK